MTSLWIEWKKIANEEIQDAQLRDFQRKGCTVDIPSRREIKNRHTALLVQKKGSDERCATCARPVQTNLH